MACTAIRIEQIAHGLTQILEIDGLRHITIETRFDAFFEDVRHHIRGQRDDRHARVRVSCFPGADFAACLVAIFAGHVKVALYPLAPYESRSMGEIWLACRVELSTVGRKVKEPTRIKE